MEQVLLVRYSEIHLKGNNRPFFENKLVSEIRLSLDGINANVERAQGRIYVWDVQSQRLQEAVEKLRRVFGIHSISVAAVVDKSFEQIAACAQQLIEEEMKKGLSTFKVIARRADKLFKMKSAEINIELGAYLLERIPGLKVDVHTPQIQLGVEIREKALIYTNEIPGAGGMPVGTNSRAVLLLSGGIDSPVAGYMVAKRGVELAAVHFHSFPYTSERAKDKVISLAGLLANYCGGIRLHIVYFTDIQMAIYEKCPGSQTTLIMRRLMMKIAERIAREEGAKALVTGESIGQVASQTVDSLVVTDDAVQLPVFRPCIGFDKVEIMDRARQIGTYDTSILPYEDCCTVFVPRHPVTHPKLEDICASEAVVDFEPLIQDALSKTQVVTLDRKGKISN